MEPMEFFLIDAIRPSGKYIFAIGISDGASLKQEVLRYFSSHGITDVKEWESSPISDIELVPTTLEDGRRMFSKLRKYLEDGHLYKLKCCVCNEL